MKRERPPQLLNSDNNHSQGQDHCEGFELENLYNLWEVKAEEDFFQLHHNEEELNRIFIEIYGLQDEMDHYVKLEDITLFKKESSIIPLEEAKLRGYNEENFKEAELRQKKKLIFNKDEVMKQFISYAVGCMFGRYSLQKEGLIIANQNQSIEEAIKEFKIDEEKERTCFATNEKSVKRERSEQSLNRELSRFKIDEDNILPILDGEYFEDDIVARFKEFLKVSLGAEHFRENLNFVEEAIGKDLRKYFVKDFYKDHVQRYKKRPIYWQFSSKKKTFNALIYMHRYQPDTVSRILNDYLRELIYKLETQREQFKTIKLSESHSNSEQKKAVKALVKIEKQLKELRAYEEDLDYVAAQRIEIDLDDGVKVNYAKFGKVLTKK